MAETKEPKEAKWKTLKKQDAIFNEFLKEENWKPNYGLIAKKTNSTHKTVRKTFLRLCDQGLFKMTLKGYKFDHETVYDKEEEGEE